LISIFHWNFFHILKKFHAFFKEKYENIVKTIWQSPQAQPPVFPTHNNSPTLSETQNAALSTHVMANGNLQDIASRKTQNSICPTKDPEEEKYTSSVPRSLKVTKVNKENHVISDPKYFENTEENGHGSVESILTQVTEEDGDSEQPLSPIFVHTHEDESTPQCPLSVQSLPRSEEKHLTPATPPTPCKNSQGRVMSLDFAFNTPTNFSPSGYNGNMLQTQDEFLDTQPEKWKEENHKPIWKEEKHISTKPVDTSSQEDQCTPQVQPQDNIHINMPNIKEGPMEPPKEHTHGTETHGNQKDPEDGEPDPSPDHYGTEENRTTLFSPIRRMKISNSLILSPYLSSIQPRRQWKRRKRERISQVPKNKNVSARTKKTNSSL